MLSSQGIISFFVQLIQEDSNLKEIQLKGQQIIMNNDLLPIIEFIAMNNFIEV